MLNNFLSTLLLFFTFLFSINAHSQNLVTNDDFEAGLASWTTWAAAPSGFWNGVWIHSNDCDIWVPAPCPYEGSTSYAQKKGAGSGNAHGGIYQVLDVVVGETYDVSGYWSGGVHTNTAGNGTWWELTVYDGVVDDATIDAAPGPNDVIIDKVEQNDLPPDANYQFQWQQFEGSFVANSTQVTLAFKHGSFYTHEAAGYMDLVTVEQRLPPKPVPTLTAWSLISLLIGLPVIAGWSRRRYEHMRKPLL